MSDLGAPEFQITPGVSAVQKRAIIGLADIRRGGQSLVSEMGSVTKELDYDSAPKSLKSVWQDQSALVSSVMNGQETAETAVVAGIEEHVTAGNQFKDIAPNLASLHFAKAAYLQQKSGLPFDGALSEAKKSRDASQQSGIPKTTPADFLSDAYILLIAKNSTEGVELPQPKAVAEATQQDPGLVKDYALVLPEEKRDEFVMAYPDEEQQALSLQLDAAVSEVLGSGLITTEEDQTQRELVIERVTQSFSQALGNLGQPGNHPYSREPGSRWSGRQVVETLANLGGDDSVRILKDISVQTTTELKAMSKQFKKKPAGERARTLKPFISFTAQVLDTLVDVDTKRGGVLAMRYLEMTALPDRLFGYFARKLVEREYFSSGLTPFLADRANVPVIKKLMGKYGSQLNTIVDTLGQIPDYSADYSLPPREEELLAALSDLGTLTPRIFERYRAKSPEDRKVFAERIRTLKPQFFRNMPIKSILDAEDRDILTEMVYVAYKPMGMSFEKVAELIGNLSDQTDDIAGYTFPKEGYDINLERRGRYAVKEHQHIDIRVLRRVRDLLRPAAQVEVKQLVPGAELPFTKAVRNILTTAPSTDESSAGTQTDESLRQMFVPFAKDSRIQEFLQRSDPITLDNAYETAGELSEIMGVLFQDNYEAAVTDYLNANDDAFAQVVSFLGDSQIRELVTARFAQLGETLDWGSFDTAIKPNLQDRLKQLMTTGSSNTGQAYVASMITKVVERGYLGVLQKEIKKELSKFVSATDKAGPATLGTLKAYISKNVGSFFAKAAAGICTAQDIPLFNRNDHFHINVVEGDELVRANIQAYITDVRGKRALVLRGFNPTADWVGKIDVESFCEQIIEIGKQFQEANGLAGVYITEQGGWHSLSNREQVGRYLIGKYHKGSGVFTSLKVASTHTVNTVYPI